MGNFEERRRLWDRELLRIHRMFSTRVALLLGRGYIYGNLDKPLEQVTDAEFLTVYGLGAKTLTEIRRVIPSPER